MSTVAKQTLADTPNRLHRSLLTLGAMLLTIAALAACGGDAEETGEEVGAALDDAADKVEDTMDEAADEVEDAADELDNG